MVGLQDVIQKELTYTRSVQCVSPTADLICVHKDDFLSLKKNEKVWKAIAENIEQRSEGAARKFREQALAQKHMAAAFGRLSGMPTQSKRFIAGDNLLRQKMAFDRMVTKHDLREKLLADQGQRDGSVNSASRSPVTGSPSPARGTQGSPSPSKITTVNLNEMNRSAYLHPMNTTWDTSLQLNGYQNTAAHKAGYPDRTSSTMVANRF